MMHPVLAIHVIDQCTRECKYRMEVYNTQKKKKGAITKRGIKLQEFALKNYLENNIKNFVCLFID